jgi:hypothetical protein
MQPVPATFDAHSFFTKLLGDTTPQRREELNDLVAKSNIRFVLDEASPGIEFWADPSTRQINVPRRCLFRMKANAFAYYCAVDALLAKRNGTADAGTDGRLQKASELLTWAVRTDVATTLDDRSSFSLGAIPKDIESLYRGCLKEEQLGLGEHIFELAVAWVLHHELAHLRLRHAVPSVRIEYEADQAATDWLLKADGLSQAERIARYFGVATGLGWLSALNVYIGSGTGGSHPPAAQRFFKGIEYMTTGVGDEAEFPWAICQMVLLLHAQNAGFPVEPRHMAGSFKDVAANLLQVIEKAKP